MPTNQLCINVQHEIVITAKDIHHAPMTAHIVVIGRGLIIGHTLYQDRPHTSHIYYTHKDPPQQPSYIKYCLDLNVLIHLIYTIHA